jgi:hypothetical protein
MEISSELVTWGVPGLVSAGVTVGILKTTLANKMSFDDHRKICEKERMRTEEVQDKIFAQLRDQHRMISEMYGYLKAQNGGTL